MRLRRVVVGRVLAWQLKATCQPQLIAHIYPVCPSNRLLLLRLLFSHILLLGFAKLLIVPFSYKSLPLLLPANMENFLGSIPAVQRIVQTGDEGHRPQKNVVFQAIRAALERKVAFEEETVDAEAQACG
jgi:hypothetical protein